MLPGAADRDAQPLQGDDLRLDLDAIILECARIGRDCPTRLQIDRLGLQALVLEVKGGRVQVEPTAEQGLLETDFVTENLLGPHRSYRRKNRTRKSARLEAASKAVVNVGRSIIPSQHKTRREGTLRRVQIE